jgi:hypothetical protein
MLMMSLIPYLAQEETMRNRLLLGLAALIVCGANAALAQRQEAHLRFACSSFDCDGSSDCKSIGCGACGTTPLEQKRCEAAAEE